MKKILINFHNINKYSLTFFLIEMFPSETYITCLILQKKRIS